jgi:gamma-glutamylcyclotransferase (GGCT)/AIG2-like uncharacterized protein YtfP
MTEQRLFVYGTLLTGSGWRAINRLMRKQARRLGPASVQGQLYDLGDYPAAIPSSISADRVYGEAYSVSQNDRTLKILDRYEDFDPERPESSLYIRRSVTALLLPSQRPITCWIYWFNGPLPFRRRIRSGRYAAKAQPLR